MLEKKIETQTFCKHQYQIHMHDYPSSIIRMALNLTTQIAGHNLTLYDVSLSYDATITAKIEGPQINETFYLKSYSTYYYLAERDLSTVESEQIFLAEIAIDGMEHNIDIYVIGHTATTWNCLIMCDLFDPYTKIECVFEEAEMDPKGVHMG